MLTECQPRLVPVGWDAGYSVTGVRGPQIPVKLGKARLRLRLLVHTLHPDNGRRRGRQWGRRRKYHTHEPSNKCKKTSTCQTNVTASLFGIQLTAVCLRFWMPSTSLTNSLVVAANVKWWNSFSISSIFEPKCWLLQLATARERRRAEIGEVVQDTISGYRGCSTNHSELPRHKSNKQPFCNRQNKVY